MQEEEKDVQQHLGKGFTVKPKNLNFKKKPKFQNYTKQKKPKIK